MVPIKRDMTWDAAHDYTRYIAQQLAATARDRYVTSATVARAGRLFIDYLRNGRGGPERCNAGTVARMAARATRDTRESS
jgi:bifunctional non-homologous end joining protein LigD